MSDLVDQRISVSKLSFIQTVLLHCYFAIMLERKKAQLVFAHGSVIGILLRGVLTF